MDLRSKNLSPEDIDALHQFIIQRKLGYQPFIFTDTLEVGEGLKFRENEKGGEVYWENADPRVKDLLAADLGEFRQCNQQLRIIYEHFLDSLVAKLGNDISPLTFAEIGCNTGYFLHGLAQRGAKRCIGYDFTNNTKVFEWFNRVLGINNEFHFAEWDSLNHSLRYAELPMVDVVLSVAVTCHLADPIHHLAYLCDHARKAVFLWSPVNKHEELSLSFGQPSKYPNALDWPLSFDNDVRLSIPLLKLSLQEPGFDQIFEIECPKTVDAQWVQWYYSQRGLIAFRTAETRTAMSAGKKARPLPGDVSMDQAKRWIAQANLASSAAAGQRPPYVAQPSLVENDYRGFNIVQYHQRYYALAMTLGPVALEALSERALREQQRQGRIVIGNSLEEIRQLIPIADQFSANHGRLARAIALARTNPRLALRKALQRIRNLIPGRKGGAEG